MNNRKEWKALWHWPKLWFILAAVSFVAGWLFWQMVDHYSSLQLSLSALPNPPTITQALWQPWLLTLGKVMIICVALTAGFSVAQERSQNTLWYLLINQKNTGFVVWQKFKPQLMLLLLLWLHLALAAGLLASGGAINVQMLLLGVLGISLYIIWLIALGMWLSSCCESTGTAVLLNIIVFVLLWALGSDVIGQEYGLSWLHLITPSHHLRWLIGGELGLSSLLYLVGGTMAFLWLTADQVARMRKSL